LDVILCSLVERYQ